MAACEQHPERPKWQVLTDAVKRGANIIAAGNPLAWFQGRMEFGPRALGCRSILGCPSVKNMADRINQQIKYRERWRPFCPSILDRVAEEILQTTHPAPYMTITFDVAEHWRTRIPEVVHVDGRPFAFQPGERIHTEISCKYTDAHVAAFAREAGFAEVARFEDAQRWFVDALWRVVPDCDDTRRYRSGFTPHLSVGQTGSVGSREQVDSVVSELQQAWRPAQFRAASVQLIWRNEPPDDVFRVGHRIRLGTGD